MKLWKPLFSVEEARLVVVGIPYESTLIAAKGAAKAPDRLRKIFSERYWSYDLNNGVDLGEQRIVDVGNVKCTKDFKTTAKAVARTVFSVQKKNPSARFLFLGGEHTVTLMTAMALKPHSMLVLDAHPDLCEHYNGNRYSIPCVSQRVRELGTSVALRGIRTASQEEAGALRELDWSKQLNFVGNADYLSLDVDVLDPVYAGTGAPESCGFTPREVLAQIRNVNYTHADLVEWIPDDGYPAVIALLRELLFRGSQ